MGKKAKHDDGVGPRDLAEGLDFIAYEFEMLHHCAIEADRDEPGLHQNAYLESFLIHARGLRDFFYRDRPIGEDKQDILAARFFHDQAWKDRRPTEPRVLQDLPEGVAKEIAHLSWRRLRVRGGKTSWKIQQILAAIRTAKDVFQALLKEQPRAKLDTSVLQICGEMPALTNRNFTTTSH